MKLEITRLEGQRNDLLLRLERSEIETALLSVANRQQLMALPGMPRHRVATAPEQQRVAESKIPLEDHLRRLGVTGEAGRAERRAVAISNRNLGTNHGHVAWQRSETPRAFRILEDPGSYPSYSCLTLRRGGTLSIEDLRFDFAADRLYHAVDGEDLTEVVEWATFGQCVVRRGRVSGIDDLAGQFYDARHLLAFDQHRDAGDRIRQEIYQGYPASFEANVRRAWRESGVPRARYVHGAIGLSADALFVLQREGTVEEIGCALASAGADDGVILDNGGSVGCWVWWANRYAGGIVSPTIDYRPPGTSAIAFILKGPLTIDLPGGSVSYSAY
jgi:hypothetical protein